MGLRSRFKKHWRLLPSKVSKMGAKLRIELCSPPDREKLVAAIMIDFEQLAEISQESEQLTLNSTRGETALAWVLDFEEAVDALLAAKTRLLER